MKMSLGVDIGGTKIAGSAVTPAGKILHRARRETPAQNPSLIVTAVVEIVEELSAALSADHDVDAVGVACAGFIDRRGESVVFSANLAWRDEPLKAHLEEAVDFPVILENDANAAAWGEFRFGAGLGSDDILMITLGTGVGGGIVAGGELLRGAHGMGGEVGHMRVVPQGERCGCGNLGCWEVYASGSALERQARAIVSQGTPHAGALSDRCGGDPEQLDGSMVTEVARTGDPAAVELFESVGRWTGEGLASLAAVLDPSLIVVGGGVSAAGDLVLQPTRTAFGRNLTGRGHRAAAKIVLAALGNDAGMIGVADLAARRT